MDYWIETGENAVRIYREIETVDEPAKLSALKKKTGLKTFEYAIGWLLREGKIEVFDEGKTRKARIKQ